MSFLTSLTPEQRAENLEKAQKARAEQQAKWEAGAHLLKQDFADAAHWRKLASKHGVRMPASIVPGSELKFTRRAARKLKLTYKDLKDSVGGIESLHELNPSWPAWALIGLLLEVAEDRDSPACVEQITASTST